MLLINPADKSCCNSVNNVDHEEKACKVQSLTGTKVKPEYLDVFHRMKKKGKVIIKT